MIQYEYMLLTILMLIFLKLYKNCKLNIHNLLCIQSDLQHCFLTLDLFLSWYISSTIFLNICSYIGYNICFHISFQVAKGRVTLRTVGNFSRFFVAFHF